MKHHCIKLFPMIKSKNSVLILIFMKTIEIDFEWREKDAFLWDTGN